EPPQPEQILQHRPGRAPLPRDAGDHAAHDDKDVRVRAAELLGQFGPAARDAAAALTEALGDDSGAVRLRAAESLWLVTQYQIAVAALVRALKEGDDGERIWAAEILEKIGPAAKAAVPALTEALQDPDEGFRKAAAGALAKVAPTDRQDTASQASDDGDSAGLDLA